MVAKETAPPAVEVTGRRYQRKEKYTTRSMRRALLWGAAAATLVMFYTVPLAQVAREGYEQFDLRMKIQKIERENEYLRTEIAALKNPRRVSAYARQSGMVMRDKAVFITLVPEQKTTSSRSSLIARLSSTFDFH